jgi:hypothetical protein
MNPEQWQSLIRTTLAIAIGPGSYLVTRGILTADQANQLAPALVPVVMAVGAIVIGKWGVSAHSATAVVAAVNSPSAPGVKVVAAASPSPTVTITKTGEIKPVAKAAE